MESANSSFAYSETASLNSVATDLNEFLNKTNYWSSPELPREIDLKLISNENEQRYFNYREEGRRMDNRAETFNKADHMEGGFSNSVTPDLELSLEPPVAEEEEPPPERLDPRLYPQNMPRAPSHEVPSKRQKPSPQSFSSSAGSEDENQEYEWKKLIKRAEKALEMKCQPETNENQIKLLFERLVGKLETFEAHQELPKCAKTTQPKKGVVIKSVPAEADALGYSDISGAASNPNEYERREICDSPSEKLIERLNDIFQTERPDQLIEQAQAARQALLQITPLKQRFMQAATRLATLTSYISKAADFPSRESFQQHMDDFPRRCEDEFSAIEGELLCAREISRLRSRLCEILGFQPGGSSIYDIIKQNNTILERVSLEQSSEASQQSGTFLEAEEFAGRCEEAGLGVQPTDPVLITYADTVLHSAGAERAAYAQECVRQAVEEHPKILVRLTDDEAFKAFQAIMFVFAHFSRLFNTRSIGRILTRLTEVHNYCEQSKSLISAEKRILGLNPAASPSKLLEAIEAIAAEAAADAGVLSVDEAEKIMEALGVEDVAQILEAVKTLTHNEEEQQEESSSDSSSE